MATVNKWIFSLLLPLAGCGLGSRISPSIQGPDAKKNLGEFLEGRAPSLEGGQMDLAAFSDEPLLLMFAGDTCSVCSTETAHLIASQSELSAYNLRIVTILAGSDRLSASEWAEDHQVPWEVGFDEDLELFEKYCPAGSTPCGFVQRPDEGIVLQRSGPIEISEIQTLLSN